jgi:hypothetical protein
MIGKETLSFLPMTLQRSDVAVVLENREKRVEKSSAPSGF